MIFGADVLAWYAQQSVSALLLIDGIIYTLKNSKILG